DALERFLEPLRRAAVVAALEEDAPEAPPHADLALEVERARGGERFEDAPGVDVAPDHGERGPELLGDLPLEDGVRVRAHGRELRGAHEVDRALEVLDGLLVPVSARRAVARADRVLEGLLRVAGEREVPREPLEDGVLGRAVEESRLLLERLRRAEVERALRGRLERAERGARDLRVRDREARALLGRGVRIRRRAERELLLGELIEGVE